MLAERSMSMMTSRSEASESESLRYGRANRSASSSTPAARKASNSQRRTLRRRAESLQHPAQEEQRSDLDFSCPRAKQQMDQNGQPPYCRCRGEKPQMNEAQTRHVAARDQKSWDRRVRY